MRREWIPFILVLAFVGCNGEGQKQPLPDANTSDEIKTETHHSLSTEEDKKQVDPLLKAQVKNRIEKIYADILGHDPSMRLELENAYLTKDFNDILTKAQLIEIDIDYAALDHDIWHQSKVWNKKSVRVDSLDFDRSCSYAYADVTLLGGPQELTIPIVLKLENGQWKILNINGDKQRLRDYVENIEKAAVEKANSGETNRFDPSRSIWERGYLLDEFGEQMTNCPYVYGEIVRGDEFFSFRVSDCEGIIIGYHRQFDALDLSEATKLSMKAHSGEVYRFAFQEKSGSLYVTDKSAVQKIIGLLKQGHFTLSVGFGSGNAYILKVESETCDIEQAWQSFYK